MKTRLRKTHAAAFSLFAALVSSPLPGWAQSVPSPTAPAALAGDPPGRVARLNYFTGNVTLEPAGATDWSYAQLNRPLTTGDQLWADSGARGELQAGSTALRLDQQTSLSIVDLDDTTMQLKVGQGSLSTRLRELPTGQTMEIDTPNVALQATSPGEFRVDVAPDGSSTTVTVRDGTATLYGDGGSYQMSAGQQARFIGVNLQQQSGGAAPAPDAFDEWVASRDRAEDGSVSARYVSRDIPGYEDLDANGTWRSDPNYGEVWVPTVAVSANWAPYHEGHWTWIAPWGWTWVDDAPWGFAPFHYGRWAYVSNSWAWVPGPMVVVQPVYAPALVAFVGGDGGGGAHWGVDLAIGGAVGAGVAWFALGPHEAWHPGYGYSPGYYNRVNSVNITNVRNTTIVNNIHNTYINQTRPGAITAVPASAFVRGQPVAQAARVLSAQQIVHAQIGAGAPAIAPVRESFTGGMRPASTGAPAALAQRQVVATRRPVVPAAYRDTLAQHFANTGGKVPGAGNPVVRTAVPAAYAAAARPVRSGVGGAPGAAVASASTQGFRVVDKAHARPVGAQGAPVRGNEPNAVAARVGAAQPGQPAQALRAPAPNQNGAQRAEGGRVPNPAEAGRAQEAQAQGEQHRAEPQAPNGAVPHPGNEARPNEANEARQQPAVAAQQHEAQPAARAEPEHNAPPAARAEPEHNAPQRAEPQHAEQQQHAEPQQHGEPQRAEEAQHNAPRPEQHAQPQPQHAEPEQQHAQQPQQRAPQQPQQHAQQHEEKPQGGEHKDERKD